MKIRLCSSKNIYRESKSKIIGARKFLNEDVFLERVKYNNLFTLRETCSSSPFSPNQNLGIFNNIT